LTSDCSAYKRKNSCADDRTDSNACQIESTKRALHLPIRRLSFGDQKVGIFRSEQLERHGGRSSHQAVAAVNPKLSVFPRRQGLSGHESMHSRRVEILL